jgi:hypothetical protein
MSLCLFNLFESADLLARSAGMVLAHGVALVRAAPNSLTRSGPSTFRCSGCHAEARRLRNLSVPTDRSLKANGSIPKG